MRDTSCLQKDPVVLPWTGNWTWTAAANVNPFLWIRWSLQSPALTLISAALALPQRREAAAVIGDGPRSKPTKRPSFGSKTFSEVVYFGSLRKGKRNLYERKQETEQQKTREVFKVHFTDPFKYQRVLLRDHFWLCLLASFMIKFQQFQISAAPQKKKKKNHLINAASECPHACHTWSQTQSVSLRA